LIALHALFLLLAADGGKASLPRPPEPDAPTVSARLDRQTARVGDPIGLTVVAIRKKGVVVNLALGPQLGKLVVLDHVDADRDLEDGSARKEWNIRLAAYEPGPFEVPPVTVTYLTGKGEVREVRTARLEAAIEAVTTESDVEIRDLAPPVRVISENRLPLYIVGGWLGLGLTFGLVVVVRRRIERRRGAAAVPPPQPAHVVALERLEKLQQGADLAQPERKAFFLGMSEILRDYLRARFGVLALTTSELGGELRARRGVELSADACEVALGWLEACDLVKFAQYPATEAEARAAAAELAELINLCAPKPVPELLPESEAA
jgi:hypothetical protein